MDLDSEQHGLLKKATFREIHHRGPVPTTQEILTRVFGTKNAPTQRVSESLDYEPVQNTIFYKRMKAAKEKKHLFGCVPKRALVARPADARSAIVHRCAHLGHHTGCATTSVQEQLEYVFAAWR
jgi:hypothetical protein